MKLKLQCQADLSNPTNFPGPVSQCARAFVTHVIIYDMQLQFSPHSENRGSFPEWFKGESLHLLSRNLRKGASRYDVRIGGVHEKADMV